MHRTPKDLNKGCKVCVFHCTKLSCSCVCTCEGPEYVNCLEEQKNCSNQRPDETSDKRSNERSKCKKWTTCLICTDHLECKRCASYRCGCLGNEITLNGVKANRINRKMDYYKRSKHDSPTGDQRCSKSQSLSRDQHSQTKNENDFYKSNKRSVQPSGQPSNQLLSAYLGGHRRKYCSNELCSQVDHDFRKLFHHYLDYQSDDKSLCELNRNLAHSINAFREHFKANIKTPYSEESIAQQNYDLDEQLNRSFRNQFDSKSDAQSDDKNVDANTEYRINKFDLFVYLSLSHCGRLDERVAQLFPESNIENTIRNLVLFMDTKRTSVDCMNPYLTLCLKNTIDSIQLNESAKLCSTLLTSSRLMRSSLFKFLSFLILDFNDSSIASVELRLDGLIALRHLEVYGKRFKFKTGRWSASSLVNLIVHDKCLKHVNVLEHFPNLLVIKVRYSSGNILKADSAIQNYFKLADRERQLQAISMPNLTFDDFIYVIRYCKNVELIECTLLSTLMLDCFKLLNKLKFVFLILKKEHYVIADSLAYLIDRHLMATNSVDQVRYTNQLYCPRDIESSTDDQPCFKPDCINCTESLFERPNLRPLFTAETGELLNKNAKSIYKKFRFNILTRMNSGERLENADKGNQTKLRKLLSDSRFNVDNNQRAHHTEPDRKNQIDLKAINKLQQCIVYLDGIKVNKANLEKFNLFYEIIRTTNTNYLKISQLNELVKLNDFNWMKEKLMQLDFIEIDEPMKLNKNDLIKLSSLIANSTRLVVRVFDFNAFDYLIRHMSYLRTIRFYKVRIDEKMSNALEKYADEFRRLKAIEIHCDKTEDCMIDFLLNCESLAELKLINARVNNDRIASILTNNVYCTNVVLSYPESKNDQFKLVEILSFNALVHRNLNYYLTFNRSDFLNLNLMPNLKIIG